MTDKAIARVRQQKSVVQGHFTYYAVPGNLDSLGEFRE